MAYEFRFPDVGQGITEGTIVKWLVKTGDKVEEDTPLAEIETDKAVVEIPSPRAGIILKRHAAKEGETIRVGEVIAVIGEKGEKSPPAEKPVRKKQVEEKGAAVVGAIPETMDELEHPESGKILATPAVRKLARDLKADIGKVKGSGQGGRITEEDVKSAAGKENSVGAQQKTRLEAEKWGKAERVELRGIRKAVAEKMSEAVRHAALLTNFDEADATGIVKAREEAKKEAEKKGMRLTYLAFIAKAVTAALKKHPNLNSSLDEEKGQIILKKYYNIGIAVDTEHGLLVPNVKKADAKSVLEIAAEIGDLAEKARQRKLSLEEFQGGTFTITNLGALGGTFFTPIPNYPESAILGIGRLEEKPMAVSGKIVARKTLPLSLTYDHRIIDGAMAARFLNDLKKLLEKPGELDKSNVVNYQPF